MIHSYSTETMERFKQTIASLEKEVANLKETLKTIKGCPPSKSDIHYATSSSEYGEYSLEDLDTFRFQVNNPPSTPNIFYYTLTNPTEELGAYLRLQGKNDFHFVCRNNEKPEDFEPYIMGKKDPSFVLTNEIRKCLESKLWDFASPGPSHFDSTFPTKFFIEITIPFKHTYTILPHISYYLSPFPSAKKCDVIVIVKEITTKQVTFIIEYGNSDRGADPYTKRYIDPELKLHYCIQGVVEQAVCDSLLN